MFSGSIPALVTPFRDGMVDEAAFRTLVDWQIDNGSSALVACGTTGESATLSYEEHYRVIQLCIDAAAGRVPVIAGCGSNDTATAVRHMEYAKHAGAAAALVVAPYYNRPNHVRNPQRRADDDCQRPELGDVAARVRYGRSAPLPGRAGP